MMFKVLLVTILAACNASFFDEGLKRASSARKSVERFSALPLGVKNPFAPPKTDNDVMNALDQLKSNLQMNGAPVNFEKVKNMVSAYMTNARERSGGKWKALSDLSNGLLLRGAPINLPLRTHQTPAQQFQPLSKLTPGKQVSSRPKTLEKFVFTNCTDVEKPPILSIHKLSIVPDPLVMPGIVNFSFAGDVTHTIPDDDSFTIKVDMKVTLPSGTTVDVPCIGMFGSCTYNNICQQLSSIGGSCPDAFTSQNIDCKCPFKKGSYVVPNYSADIQVEIFEPGFYQVRAEMTNSQGFVGCYNIGFTIA